MNTLKRIYGASFVFSLSLALTAYVNSSFLSEHVGASLVGVVYAVAALLTILGLEFIPRFINRIGNRNIILILVLLNISSLAFLSMNLTMLQAASAFILFNTTNSLIWYSLDIFIEHFSENKKVGSIRGAYLSLTNFAWLFAPILTGLLVSLGGYQTLYGVVLVCIVIVGVILRFSLRSYHDRKYRPLSTFQALRMLWGRPDLLRITFVNFILQFFYTWMVVYTPLYLHEVHGISFGTIGIMFTVMLIAFTIFEYPIGRLSDSIHHEREFLQIGILIMAAATFFFGYDLAGANIVLLTVILFFTRVGASIVEVITESYFFKSVTDKDAEIISLFRMTSPIAYLFAPLIATAVLFYEPYKILFFILGGIILTALFALDKLSNTV